jgi:hypothetical protein
MDLSVNDTLTMHLLRLTEASPAAVLSGQAARRYSAGEIDRLLVAGVLEELAPATEWSPCADCECALGCRPIRVVAGRIIACCPIDLGSDLELGPEDLRAFRIDVGRLLQRGSRASGIAGPPETMAPGLWSLGRLASGRTIVVALPARALRAQGAVLLLKSAGGPVTVLAHNPDQTTRLRLLEADIDLIELRSALVPGAVGVDRLDRDALEPRTEGPRLSIHLEAQAVLVDGTFQRVPSQPFKLLALLARAARDRKGPVRNRAIEDATGRDARDLVRGLRDALSAGRPNGSELRDWIEARRSLGAFELVLLPEQIEIVS